MCAYNFLFYDNSSGAPKGWAETLDFLGGTSGQVTPALTKRLVKFATRFRLSGNVWQQWISYVLMMHENPFTLACERQTIDPEATIFKLVSGDFGLFRELMHTDVADFTDYIPPYGSEPGDEGIRIAELTGRLAAAQDNEEFGRIAADYYAQYGVGMYGLYKAFDKLGLLNHDS